ncbi:MAG: hypothetical protein U0326_13310 [Polyangiales bacterium]
MHAQLARLSDALGVSLYERRGRALQLTADGERVAAFARDVTERAERFVAERRRAGHPDSRSCCARAPGRTLYLLGRCCGSGSPRRACASAAPHARP